jgi:hypothetical protein
LTQINQTISFGHDFIGITTGLFLVFQLPTVAAAKELGQLVVLVLSLAEQTQAMAAGGLAAAQV